MEVLLLPIKNINDLYFLLGVINRGDFMENNKDKVIKLSLIIVIILLMLFIIYLLLGKESDKKLKPSGNVDIFEINCNLDCDCDNDNTKPVFGENGNLDNFDILENGISWDKSKELNIFANPMYEMENKVAPETTNFYQFVVKNGTNYNVNYSINFDEENDYRINMKYRLLKNNEYVVGDEKNWVTYDKLNVKDAFINSNNSETYYLEWKWFSSDNDTKIGEAIDVNYELKINIKAMQTK